MAETEKKSFMTVLNEFRASLEERADKIKAKNNEAEAAFKRWVEVVHPSYKEMIAEVDGSIEDWEAKNAKKVVLQREYDAKRNAAQAKLFAGIADEEKAIREISNLFSAFLPTLKTTSTVLDEFMPVLRMLIGSARGDVSDALAMILGDGLLAGFNECVEKITFDHKYKMSKLWADSLARHRDALTSAGFTREEAIHLIGTLHGPLQQYVETVEKFGGR